MRLLPVVLLLLAGPAWASGQGMSVTALTPARQGAARVAVEVRDDAVLARLRSQGMPVTAFNPVVGRGRAQVTAAVSGAAEPVYTVLAFDASGSFASNTDAAVALARQYAAAVPTDGRHTTEVVTFGTVLHAVGAETDRAALDALLGTVGARTGKESVTRLKSLVEESVKRAAAALPLSAGGLRQVVVFTDAGEESGAYRIEDVVASARSQGVQVHVVVFPPTKGKDLAQRLDEMRRLAEETGGRNVMGTDPGAGAALTAIADGGSRNVWLDVRFCGVQGASGADTLSVEVLDGGQRRAWTEPAPLDQDGLGPAAAPCPDAAAVAPVAADAPAAPAPTPGSPWPWVLGGLAALLAGGLGLAALALLLRGRREPQKAAAAPPAPPPPPPRPPVEAPASDVVAPAPPLRDIDPFGIADLPETRLVVVQAPPGASLRPYYRLHKPIVVVGARADADVDLVFDVAQVSGRHVRLELYKLGTVFATDLDSTNGTFVNGQAVARGARVPLAAGDVLGVSRHLQLRIEQPGLAARVSAPAASPEAPSPAAPPPAAPPERKRAQTIYAPVKPPTGEDP